MTCLRFDSRVLPLLLGLLTASACGDDGSTDSTTAAETTSGTSANASTGDPATDGSSGSPTSDSGQVATDTATDTTATDGTADATEGTTVGVCEETVGPEDGTMVASCDECTAEQLCMQLTEHGGPADGGGPTVTLHCFPIPVCCDAAIDCDCAGHLCPEKVVGGESSCQTTNGLLDCDVAFP